MRWYRDLTPTQRRIIASLLAAVILVTGGAMWAVWTTIQSWPQVSPLPTPTPSPPTDTPTASPTLTPTPPPTATPKPTITPIPTFDPTEAGAIAAEVAEARGVIQRWSTPLTLIDRAELMTLLEAHYQTHPPLALEIRTTLDLLALWHWAAPEEATTPAAPPRRAAPSIDLITQARYLAAWYVPEEGQIYLRRDWRGDLATLRHQLAYAYARAIPEQYGELARLRRETISLDHRIALRAVAEGDALLGLWRYAGLQPGSAEAEALTEEVLRALPPRWHPRDLLLTDLARLTFDLGQQFAVAQYQAGGLEALNTALIRPPRSTEQMLHPTHYRGNQEPLVLMPLTPDLGQGWVEIHTEIIGEALMGLTMLEWSNGQIGAEATVNWGGDLLQAWEGPEGARVVLWQTAWDSSGDAAHFYGEMLAILPGPHVQGQIPDAPAPVTLPQSRWWANETGALSLGRAANRVILVWGATPDAVERAVLALPFARPRSAEDEWPLEDEEWQRENDGVRIRD